MYTVLSWPPGCEDYLKMENVFLDLFLYLSFYVKLAGNDVSRLIMVILVILDAIMNFPY